MIRPRRLHQTGVGAQVRSAAHHDRAVVLDLAHDQQDRLVFRPVRRDARALQIVFRQTCLDHAGAKGFGARGLVWSALAAELLASQLEGDPLPLTRDLCEAVDPARFVLRPPITGRIDE